MKRKVYISGIGQTNYIFQLYDKIYSSLKESIIFNSLDLNTKSTFEQEKADHIFEKNIKSQNKRNYSIIILLIFYKYIWNDLILNFIENGICFRKIKDIVSVHIKNYTQAKLYSKFLKKDDVLHLHFPNTFHCGFVRYLNQSKKNNLIVSFWGSDIYRCSNLIDKNFQSKLLNEAKYITVSTPEMRFNILTRYGFKLINKISILKFILQEDFYKIADSTAITETEIINYKQKNQIPIDKKIIVFGHNGNSNNNHLQFINAIKSELPNSLKDYHIIFPFAYGDNGKNEKAVKEVIEKSEKFTILKHYMDAKELVYLKTITNLYIHTPTTDGLSAYLTEYFYLNKTCIVADWLPYDAFMNAGIQYLSMNGFDNLGSLIIESENKSFINKDNIKNNFLAKSIAPLWVNFYKKTINE
ncbi:hypothetical protein [Ornithobacterium rhinotracheale]|uniref:hypothetical protein n=1 Tax=Ornithobacterium rhinotracheale TaxID=28251 RepID=UPI004035A1AD